VSMPFNAGAVIYAKSVLAVSSFYAEVADLQVTHSEQDYVVLESAGFQLVVLATPAQRATSIHITSPPERRENTPIKLVFYVASVADARQMAKSLGGMLNPPAREWEFQGSCVCDGHDPEGNVVQFREIAL
jgi:predicted enzyme related to lactoylglutathione lyase